MIICPACRGIPVYSDGTICSTCEGACEVAAPPPSLNHGGPGICRLCYPNGAPTPLQPLQQGELLL